MCKLRQRTAGRFHHLPYCGKKVKGKSTADNLSDASAAISEKLAPVGTAIGSGLDKAGKVSKKTAGSVFDFLKDITGKAAEWLKSLDWSKAGDFFKETGSKIGPFVKRAIVWIKGTSVKVWEQAKRLFNQARDFLAKNWNPTDPATCQRTAVGIIAAVLILFILLLVIIISGNSGGTGEPGNTSSNDPNSQIVVAPTDQKWLVMIYADADDEILEEDIYFDLNELETVGSTDRVQIVTQIDRFNGAFSGDGDWTGTRRYFITKDDDLTRLALKWLLTSVK